MKKLGIALFVFSFSVPAVFATTLTTNLLTNPGAEAGSIAGWTPAGPGSPTVDSGSFDPGINPHTGKFDFLGFSGASDSLSQTVSLLTQGITASLLDSGSVSANLSFWEQGLNQGPSSDDAAVMLTFINGSGTSLGSVDSGQIDSHNSTWENYSNGYLIPTGTRSIDYTMQFTRHVGTDLDSFVDDNNLTLSTNTSPSPVPEPGSLALLGTGLLSIVAVGRRKISRLKEV